MLYVLCVSERRFFFGLECLVSQLYLQSSVWIWLVKTFELAEGKNDEDWGNG